MLRELEGSNRVLLFDTIGNFLGRETPLVGYDVLRSTKALREYLRENIRLPFRAIYQPVTGNKAQQFEIVSFLAYKTGWLVYAVDEVDSFCDAGQDSVLTRSQLQAICPGAENSGLYEIANYSRHKPMAFVCTSRRPAQVWRGLTSQCSELRIFRMTEKIDLDYFVPVIGRSQADRLPNLAPYAYLRYVDGAGEAQVCGGAE